MLINISKHVSTTVAPPESLSTEIRIPAGFTLLLISAYGILINCYVFFRFVSSSKFRSDFHILCISRSISNFMTCFVFFIWASPCTLIGFLYLPNIFNIVFGQTAGWGGYVSGLMVQWVISINRFHVSYWPFGGGQFRKQYLIYLYLSIVWITASIYMAIGFPSGCSFIYVIEELSWSPQNDPCAYSLADFLLYTVVFISTNANALNVLTFGKLIYDTKRNEGVISSLQSSSRQRRNRLMFAQSCVQDMLHVIDMIMSVCVSQLNNAVWFRFLTMSISWLSVHVIDGTVMLAFNKDIHPCKSKPTLLPATVQMASKIH